MAAQSVLIHCNANVETGMGHLMRSLALAEEAASRGWEVRLVGELTDQVCARASRQQPTLTIEQISAGSLESTVRAAVRDGAAVVHFDSYEAVPDLSDIPVLISNMQDGPFGMRRADLAIDANFGAEAWFERPKHSRNHLAGIDVAVIRRQVLQQRHAPRSSATTPRVLVVMGGTDPHQLSPRIAAALSLLPDPMRVTIVAPSSEHDAINRVFDGTPHTVALRTFVDDLPAIANQNDFAISAAGSSVWDFACMGVPMAIVSVVDNQQRGYRAALDAELALGLGEPPHSDLAEHVAALSTVLTDAHWLYARSNYLRGVVDGKGAWRIVSAWEELASAHSTSSASFSGAPLTARRAHRGDARTLFEWRNDDATRSNSRTNEPLVWNGHVDWLERCLADPERLLLIVQRGEENVATVRWDKRAERNWEVSITVAPSSRGQGLSAAVLAAGEYAFDVEGPVRMLASINTENRASRRLFQRAGYLPHLPADQNGFETRAKWRLTESV